MDFCGFHGQPFSDWVDPAKQLANWRSLRDAIGTASNDTIYLSICPHGTTPATGTAAPWYKNGTGLVYAPPPEWTTDERRGLANSILVQGLRHYFGPCLTASPALHHSSRAVRQALVGGHADGMLIGACDPML